MKNKISAVINTYNAEKDLEQVLTALEAFDEIVVCDMESTDATRSIAQRHGCKIVTFPRGQHRIVEPARNFAVSQASSPWVLVVDADEIVTDELRQYLYQRLEEPDLPAGFFIPRHNMFMGQFLGKRGTDHQLRFFKRQGLYWPETIHSVPHVEGRIEKIPSNDRNIQLVHLADETMAESFEKYNRYTSYEVIKKQHKHYSALALVYRPLWRFLRSYLLKGDVWRGRRGLLHSLMAGLYQFMLVSKIIEKELKEEPQK